MADYAGAVAAIRAKFVAEWISAPDMPRTVITFVNETPEDPWPPKNTAGQFEPFVLLEVVLNDVDHPGTGTPGKQVYVYRGLIQVHVFVPVNTGVATAHELAVAAGEIFRNKLFYNGVTDGCYLRSWSPGIDGGGRGDDDGAWFRVSATTQFEYYHLG